MISSPHSTCLLTTSATASRTASCNSFRREPGCFSSASSKSTTSGVRGRLPVCVVRIRSVMKLKAAHDLGHVLDIRRRCEAVADQFSPFMEIRGFPEILGVVFECFPLDEKPVALRHLVRSLQGHEFAAFGAHENRRGLFHARLKLGFHAGLDVYLCNFKNHGRVPWRSSHWERHYGPRLAQ